MAERPTNEINARVCFGSRRAAGIRKLNTPRQQVIGGKFRDEDRIEPNQLLRFAGPSALTAGRAPGEAGPALQRFEQGRHLGGVVIDP
jgi:hypothetical protein